MKISIFEDTVMAIAAALVAAAVTPTPAFADVDVRLLASSCGICHGTDGRPPKNGLDRLAGRSVRDFVEEMREMRSEGEGRLMSVIARGYSDAEILAMATYFSKLGKGDAR